MVAASKAPPKPKAVPEPQPEPRPLVSPWEEAAASALPRPAATPRPETKVAPWAVASTAIQSQQGKSLAEIQLEEREKAAAEARAAANVAAAAAPPAPETFPIATVWTKVRGLQVPLFAFVIHHSDACNGALVLDYTNFERQMNEFLCRASPSALAMHHLSTVQWDILLCAASSCLSACSPLHYSSAHDVGNLLAAGCQQEQCHRPKPFSCTTDVFAGNSDAGVWEAVPNTHPG